MSTILGAMHSPPMSSPRSFAADLWFCLRVPAMLPEIVRRSVRYSRFPMHTINLSPFRMAYFAYCTFESDNWKFDTWIANDTIYMNNQFYFKCYSSTRLSVVLSLLYKLRCHNSNYLSYLYNSVQLRNFPNTTVFRLFLSYTRRTSSGTFRYARFYLRIMATTGVPRFYRWLLSPPFSMEFSRIIWLLPRSSFQNVRWMFSRFFHVLLDNLLDPLEDFLTAFSLIMCVSRFFFATDPSFLGVLLTFSSLFNSLAVESASNSVSSRPGCRVLLRG